jgi:hypothetical protein
MLVSSIALAALPEVNLKPFIKAQSGDSASRRGLQEPTNSAPDYCEDYDYFAKATFGAGCAAVKANGFCAHYDGAVAATCQVTCKDEFESLINGDCTKPMDYDVGPKTFYAGKNCTALLEDTEDVCSDDINGPVVTGFCQKSCMKGLKHGYCEDYDYFAKATFGAGCAAVKANGFCARYDGAVAAACQVTCKDELQSLLNGDCLKPMDYDVAPKTFYSSMGTNCTTFLDGNEELCDDPANGPVVTGFCQKSCAKGLKSRFCEDAEAFAIQTFGAGCSTAAQNGFCPHYSGAVAAACQVSCSSAFESNLVNGSCSELLDYDVAPKTFYGGINCSEMEAAGYCSYKEVRTFCRKSCPLSWDDTIPPSPPTMPMPPAMPPMTYCSYDHDELIMKMLGVSCAEYKTHFLSIMSSEQVYTPDSNSAGSVPYKCDADALDDELKCELQGVEMTAGCFDGFKKDESGDVIMVDAGRKFTDAGHEKLPSLEFLGRWMCMSTCQTVFEQTEDCSLPNDYNTAVSMIDEKMPIFGGATLCRHLEEKCEDPTVVPGLEKLTMGELVSSLCQLTCKTDGKLVPKPEKCVDGSHCQAGYHCACVRGEMHRGLSIQATNEPTTWKTRLVAKGGHRKLLFSTLPTKPPEWTCKCMPD